MTDTDLATVSLTMSSLEIAGLTGKHHYNVLRDADKMLNELGVGALKFEASYISEQGKTVRCLNLPKRETLILVSGYSVEMRARIIDRWMQLEAALHADGGTVMTDLDPAARKVIGGIIKAIVHSEIANMIPAMVEAEIAKSQLTVVQGITAGEVIQLAGISDRRGTRGLATAVSRMLFRYHAVKAAPVKLARLGMRTAYAFDPALCRAWLDECGKETILKRVQDKRGQGRLHLIGKMPKAPEQPVS